MGEIVGYNKDDYQVNLSGRVVVRNVPKKKVRLTKEGKKFVGKIIVVTLAGVAVLSSFKISKDKNKTIIIPDYMTEYDADYEVKTGDTWGKIAKMYYDEEEAFETFSQFKNNIKEANPDGLRPGHNIKVPNVTEDQLLDRLEQIDYMIATYADVYEEYNVVYGDTLINIAERIVVDNSQMSKCMDMIRKANNISGDNIQLGRNVVPKKNYFELLALRDYVKGQLEKSLLMKSEKSNGKH